MLPQELVDSIIDHLFDDPVSLKTCALVSKSWLPSTRHHIFHHIRLDPSQNPNPTKSLCRLLKTTPEIRPCVQHLHL
ncbi:hypothetical protein K435DRAFT_703039, partial [Dendrothele bispora CBS 962.96]